MALTKVKNIVSEVSELSTTEGGATSLYYDNALALTTQNSGVLVTTMSGSGVVRIATKPSIDNGSISGLANLDSAGVLQWITGGELATNKFYIYDYINNDLVFSGTPLGEVALYYSGIKTLKTTSTGAKIENLGAVDQTLDILNNNSSGSARLRVGYSTGACMDIFREGSSADIYMNTIQADSDIYFQSAGETMALMSGNASVYLYYNGSERIRTTSTGAYFTGGRPITVNAGSGYISLKGSTGGWAEGVSFIGSGDTYVGGFGALGSADTLTHWYIGTAYDDAQVYVYPTTGTFIADGCFPLVTNSYNLGQSTHKWHTVYALTGTINTSDERKKTTVSGSDLGLDFINELHPVSYKMKDEDYEYEQPTESGIPTVISGTNTFHRRHYGLIAQEVEATLSGIGKDTEDFAGYVYDEEGDEYALRYTEFIAPMIKAIQELKAENDELRGRIEALEA